MCFTLTSTEVPYVEPLTASEHQSVNTHIKEKEFNELFRAKVYSMEITHYTAFCNTGCIGFTRTGVDVRNTTQIGEYGIIAVDPTIIPLHSTVMIDGALYKAEDTGGDIKGSRIDILVASKKIAWKLGRMDKTILVLLD